MSSKFHATYFNISNTFRAYNVCHICRSKANRTGVLAMLLMAASSLLLPSLLRASSSSTFELAAETAKRLHPAAPYTALLYNPYIKTLEDSRSANDLFNYYFEKSLEEKEKYYKSLNKTYDPKRFQIQSYAVQLPQAQMNQGSSERPSTNLSLNQNLFVPLATPATSAESQKFDCQLNNMDFIMHPWNPYPKDPNDPTSGRQFFFRDKVNSAYCQLQKTFQSLHDVSPLMVTTTINPIEENSYSQKVSDLSKKDTLVVVIPSTYGEYIPQLPFGELFGQGLQKIENTNYKSNFEKDFSHYISEQKLNTVENGNFAIDSRFLMKNLRAYYQTHNHNEESLYSPISIDQWIKVASYDDYSKQSLFKVATLNLEPMSLESLGKQEELAIIYLRRLNKFMKVYKNMNGSYPSQIYFVGYARGAAVAYEMLALINEFQKKEVSSESPSSEKLKHKVASGTKEWSKKIKAMVSLGGSGLGSTLADEKVIFREKSSDQAKLQQSIVKLVASLKIVGLSDFVKLEKIVHRSSYSISFYRNNEVVTALAEDDRRSLELMSQKIIANYSALKSFQEALGNLKIVKTTLAVTKAITAIKKLVSLYKQVIQVIETAAQPRYLAHNAKIVQTNVQQWDWNQFSQIYFDLMAAGRALSPTYAEYSLSNSKEWFSVLKRFISNSELDKTAIPVVSQQSEFFTRLILENYGLNQFKRNMQSILDPQNFMTSENMIQNVSFVLNEVNLSILFFRHYVLNTWYSESESGTLSRLEWLYRKARVLPSKVRYYSVAGILGDQRSEFYKNGLGFGFNSSTDEIFMDNDWKSHQNVSRNNFDGLDDRTFAGTSWNDGYVDWYKSVLWPHMVTEALGAATERDGKIGNSPEPIRSKVLGLVRTHHWGLAFPFIFSNETSVDPTTGRSGYKNEIFENVNPFPRVEMLKAMVLSIDADRSQKQNQETP